MNGNGNGNGSRETLPEPLRTVGAREEVLDAVASAPGPVTKPRIVERTDDSRSTVDRAIRELEYRNLLQRADGGWDVTLAGQLLLDEYRSFRCRATGIGAVADVLAHLPPDAPIDPAVFADAEVVRSGRSTPSRPIERHLEYVRAADRVRIVATALSDRYVETYRTCIVDRGLTVDAVCPPGIVERLVGEYSEATGEMLDTGRFHLRELPEEPPFSHVVIEGPETTRINLVIYAPDGACSYVGTDHPAAVAWAERRFERCREAAVPVPTPGP